MPLPARFRIYRSLQNPTVLRIHDRSCHVSWIYCLRSAKATENFLTGLQAGSPCPCPDAVAFERRS